MPRYTVSFLIFHDESELAWEGKRSSTSIAETDATTYFVAGGAGPLANLTKSALTLPEARAKLIDETLTPEDQDYAAQVTLFGAAAAQAAE